MATVWNKLTLQISTWFGDEKRRSAGQNGLRNSCSLSTLNQKNLRIVRSSKSSENLHRLQQQHHAIFSAKNYAPPNGSIATGDVIATSPSTSSQCSSGINTTSGYSTTDGAANSNGNNGMSWQVRRKKSIGTDFLQNLRIKKLKKTFSAAAAAAATVAGTSKSPDQGISEITPPSCTIPVGDTLRRLTLTHSPISMGAKYRTRSKSAQRQKRGESVMKGASIDYIIDDMVSDNTKNYAIAPVRSSLFHTLPMSMSWHSNLNTVNNVSYYRPSGRAIHNAAPTAAHVYPSLLNNWYFGGGSTAAVNVSNQASDEDTSLHRKSQSIKHNTSAGPSLKRFATEFFNNSFIAQKHKPKRSRSVGVVRSDQVITNAPKLHAGTNLDDVRPHKLLMMTQQGYSADECATINALLYVDDSLVYNNQRAIDANFLALAQKDQPVLNDDRVFRRLEKLGEGSYATVYKSENKLDGSVVALKEIKLQPQEGLPFTAIREVSLLRDLKHANIVCLYQIIHQPHSLILVFEYVKTDLSKYMERHRCAGVTLEPFQIKVLLFQLLRGLAFCHERKILHRDLKPQNLLVSESGELKLADFGLARAKSVPCRTFSHDVVTLWYRPPDVLLGSTHYSTSLDMWGVGCIFAEMCSGVALFPGVNDAADQLERIFAIRGLPDTVAWPDVLNLPNYEATINRLQYAYKRLEWRSVDTHLAQLLAMNGGSGAELLESFLQMNPAGRISARDAMKHNYFNSLPYLVHQLKPTDSVMTSIREYERQQSRGFNAKLDDIGCSS